MKNKTSGFALIEVIVAIVILSVVLAAAVGLLYSVSIAVEKNRDRLTATYLAQECLELVRNARDTAWRNHHQWDCAWTSDCSEKFILSSIKQDPVKVNREDTKFSRDFVIGGNELSKESFSAEKAEITCNVFWEEEKISISEILTNWRKL